MTEALQEQLSDTDQNTELMSDTAEQSTEESTASTDTAETKAVETDEQKTEREKAEKEAERADKKQKALDRRFAEITAEKHAERARADALAREIEALKQQKPAVQEDGEPKREAFDDYESYLDARATYRAEQQAKRIVEDFAKQQKAQMEAQGREQRLREEINAYRVRQQEIAKSIPDYREVLDEAKVELPPQVLQMLTRLEDGPLLIYHLAKSPELQAQFSTQAPEMHGVLLGQLSATLKASAKTVSSAPAPGKPSGTKPGASSEPPTDPEKYMEWASKNMR